jgi:hypothetical protein
MQGIYEEWKQKGFWMLQDGKVGIQAGKDAYRLYNLNSGCYMLISAYPPSHVVEWNVQDEQNEFVIE